MRNRKVCRLINTSALAVITLFEAPISLASNVAITEWMYSGDEFVELTNLSNSPVDFSGWSFDDDSRTPGIVSLSAFGVVGVGESVILAEADSTTFRSNWGLSDSIKVIGGNTTNLGRSDEINLFNASNVLVDRLTYSDVNFPGSPRTQLASANPSNLAVLAEDTSASGWILSGVNDSYGSHLSTQGYIANPGQFTLVPLPTAFSLMLSALGFFSLLRKKSS